MRPSSSICSCAATNSVSYTHLARTDIADYLGLTVETISRTLTRLRAERLIDMVSPTEIVLSNHAALEELAAGMS